MASISLVALAAALAAAADAPPRTVAVVTARATIVAGVRVPQDGKPVAPPALKDAPLPRPRERPCPERDRLPCRLIVTDLP